MSGEQLGYLMNKLMSEGALDVYFTNIFMKKNRPAVMLTVLCTQENKECFSEMLLRESSTFGVRYSAMERDILDRRIVAIATSYGQIRIKLGFLQGSIIKYSPEYDDCVAAATQYNKPIQTVYSDIMSEAGKLIKQGRIQ